MWSTKYLGPESSKQMAELKPKGLSQLLTTPNTECILSYVRDNDVTGHTHTVMHERGAGQLTH